MPPYVVLARKWRPAQFSDIVGQSHIVRTLMNAIQSERLHQAYLFTGSRGIGKTSIARIFAKVVRCTQVESSNGILRSCDQCSSCKEITASTSVDVIEIDGASNNGVEAVREIRENTKYMPSTGTRKIYIIDEVHMLTTAAFNALLKTLEEPHKIPATILSRCQRFDYRRVTVGQIQTRLKEVTHAEGIQVEVGALALIARAAEGSMRDSLSLLDQVIAFSGNLLTVQSVRESVGLIEGQALLEILGGIFNRKPLDALAIVEQVYQRGHDLRVLTRSLIEFLHGALLAKIGSPDSSALELSEEEWKELKAIAQIRSLEELELIFQVLHQGLEWLARSPQPKIVLDVLIIKCATADALIFVDSAPQAPAGNQGTRAPAQPLPSHVATPKASVEPKGVLSVPTLVEAPREVQAETPAPQVKTEKSWEGFIEHVRKSRPLLASILEHSSSTQLPVMENSDRCLLIYFSTEKGYFREQLHSRVYQEQLSHLSKEYLGAAVRLQIELRNSGESMASRKEREEKDRIDTIKMKAQNHPILREAKSLFGGELAPIEIKERASHADL